MKFVALFGTIFVGSTAAVGGYIGVAAPGPIGTENPVGRKIYEDAGRNPNATDEIEFKRTYEENEETWTWRINISEVAVPDIPTQLGRDDANYSMDHRVVNTQWQLGWPETEDDSFLDLLTDREIGVYFHTRILLLPTNVTDKYDENDNGDCVPMLGEGCTQRIADKAIGNFGEEIDYSQFEECRDTINQAPNLNRYDLGSGVGFGWDKNSSLSPNLGNFSLSRSDPMMYYTTGTYKGDNSTTMDYMKGAVHVLIMSFSYDPTRPRSGSDTGASLLCRIVDPEAAKMIGSNDSDDSGGSDQPNVNEPGAASSVVQLSLSSVLVMVLISSILTM